MKMIVLGTNAQGEPEFHSSELEAGKDAIENGDHYDMAIQNAEYNSFNGPFVAFDENDQAAKQLPELAEWMSGKPILNAITESVYSPLWVVIHTHKEGTTDYSCYAPERPDPEDVIGGTVDPEQGEFADVYGPFMAPSTNAAMLAFISTIAGLLKWGGVDNGYDAPNECDEPSEGAWDSHAVLMSLINDARGLIASKPFAHPKNNVGALGAPEKSRVNVYMEVYACDDYGNGPSFAELEATPQFCAYLDHLAALCISQQLSEVRVLMGPDAWGPGDIEDDLRVTMPELVVTRTSFWFRDRQKHASYHVETRAIEINSFCKAVHNHVGTEPLYFGSSIEWLKESIANLENAAA